MRALPGSMDTQDPIIIMRLISMIRHFCILPASARNPCRCYRKSPFSESFDIPPRIIYDSVKA